MNEFKSRKTLLTAAMGFVLCVSLLPLLFIQPVSAAIAAIFFGAMMTINEELPEL